MGVLLRAVYSECSHYHVKGTEPEKVCVKKKPPQKLSVKKWYYSQSESEVKGENLKLKLKTAFAFDIALQPHHFHIQLTQCKEK